MGESKTSRSTKNSQKAASLEEQNKILQEVLKASSQNSNETVINEKADPKNIQPGNSQAVGAEGDKVDGDRKRKADPQSEEPDQAKKLRREEPVNQNNQGKDQIFEYPDYEANREDDFDEGRQVQVLRKEDSSRAGVQTTHSVGERHGKPET